jgi:hypothetical protein
MTTSTTTSYSQLDLDIRPISSMGLTGAGAAGSTELIHTAEADGLPTSFGVFKPVGYVMIGVPTQAQLNELVSALHGAGWPASSVRQFSPQESVAELQAMVDKAGPLSGFGYEITLLRRYLTLAAEGYRWLLVRAKDSQIAAAAAEVARARGATLAVYYRTLTVEDLIP